MAAELTKMLAAAAAPVYLLDERRRIIYCNPACAAWLGMPAEELIGTACAYSSSTEPSIDAKATRVAGLCPPPEVFSGRRTAAAICYTRGDGCLVRRRAEFIPLADDADAWPGVLIVADPQDLPTDAGASAAELPAGFSAEAADESLLLHQRLQQFHHELRRHGQMDRLVGDSPAMARVRAQVQLVSAETATVLVSGPVGSGRQHVARAVHYARRGAEAGSLVPLSCALLGTELLRSTLLALLRRDGDEPRSTDTLLLGDVHDLPAELQAELAGYLKGASSPLRIVSTSIAPLDELAATNRFRADLAFALSTVVIHLPPLAQRREDVPLLAQAFLEELNARGAKQLRGFSPEALDQLAAYAWPGNIDELAAMIREAHAKAEGHQVVPADLPQQIRLAAAAGRRSRRGPQPIALEGFLATVERELISRALRLAKGNKTKAARLLSLTRPRLYRRMVQLGLETEGPAASDERSVAEE
jgi:DNA-binding NtrC family response regulator